MEEKALKSVRRKIRNRVSTRIESTCTCTYIHIDSILCFHKVAAQESRKRKKELMQTLEDRYSGHDYLSMYIYANL